MDLWWQWVAVGLAAWIAASIALAVLWSVIARSWRRRRRANRKRRPPDVKP